MTNRRSFDSGNANPAPPTLRMTNRKKDNHTGAERETAIQALSLRATDLLGQVETGMTKVKTHIGSIGFASLSLGELRRLRYPGRVLQPSFQVRRQQSMKKMLAGFAPHR